MGVLDDAIREHLELKRQHGAPKGEVEQQEQEALGAPVRRPVESAEGAADGEAVEQPPAAAEAPAEPEQAAVEPEAPAREPEPPVEEEAADPMPESVEPPPEPVEPEPEPAPDDLARQPEPDWDFEPEPAEPDTEPPAGGDTPPRGFERVDDAPAEESDEDDVLEETPDFLQETPEHDRLWFEQKPPRDFDFDE